MCSFCSSLNCGYMFRDGVLKLVVDFFGTSLSVAFVLSVFFFAPLWGLSGVLPSVLLHEIWIQCDFTQGEGCIEVGNCTTVWCAMCYASASIFERLVVLLFCLVTVTLWCRREYEIPCRYDVYCGGSDQSFSPIIFFYHFPLD